MYYFTYISTKLSPLPPFLFGCHKFVFEDYFCFEEIIPDEPG